MQDEEAINFGFAIIDSSVIVLLLKERWHVKRIKLFFKELIHFNVCLAFISPFLNSFGDYFLARGYFDESNWRVMDFRKGCKQVAHFVMIKTAIYDDAFFCARVWSAFLTIS